MRPICRALAYACSLVAWALGVMEARHSPNPETRPVFVAEALPPEPPHTHREYDRSVHITLNEVAVSGGKSTDALPPGRGIVDTANAVIHQRWERQYYHPAYRRGMAAPLATST